MTLTMQWCGMQSSDQLSNSFMRLRGRWLEVTAGHDRQAAGLQSGRSWQLACWGSPVEVATGNIEHGINMAIASCPGGVA